MPHVYVIAWSGAGPSKIGKAACPVGRLHTLQGACPYRLRIYGALKVGLGGRAAQLEHLAHGALSDCRMLGEWFDLAPSAALARLVSIADENRIFHAPWSPTARQVEARRAQVEDRARRSAALREWADLTGR